MTIGAHGPDEHRVRVAVIFLVVGIVLVLFAWGHWNFRTRVGNVDSVVATDAPEEATESARIVRLAPLALLVAFLLLLVFLMGSFVIARASRRRRERTGRRPYKPTESQDVWAMHKPPPDPGSGGATRP